MNNLQHYLDYLDKEMTIMGILSAFCVAVPSLIFERIFSVSKDSIYFYFLLNLQSNGLAYIIIASLLFLGGAAFYYKQRSKLAWYYGQISLESTIPNYTGSNLEQWLKEADSWKAWLPYNLAFWILVSSLFDYIFAILSIYSSFIQQKVILIAILHLFLTSIWLWWVRRNSMLYKYETKLPYFQFKKKKVSNVK